MTDIDKLIAFLTRAKEQGVKTVSFYRRPIDDGLEFVVDNPSENVLDYVTPVNNIELPLKSKY